MLSQIRTRPHVCTMNYFRFKTKGNFYRYQMLCEPQINEQDEMVFKKIMRLCLKDLKENFKIFCFGSKMQFYSPEEREVFKFKIVVESEGEESVEQEHCLTVQKVGTVDINQPEHINVLGRFFKTLQGSLRLKNIG